MNYILFVTSLFYDLHCFPPTPLVTAVTAPPRFKGKEHDPTLACQSRDKKSIGGGYPSLENIAFHPLSELSICFL